MRVLPDVAIDAQQDVLPTLRGNFGRRTRLSPAVGALSGCRRVLLAVIFAREVIVVGMFDLVWRGDAVPQKRHGEKSQCRR
jgi:hypothetical protein